MPEVMNFFPLTVYADRVEGHEAFREKYAPIIKSWVPESRESEFAWTGDVNERGFLHLDESFSPLFDAFMPHLKGYLETLEIKVENLELFCQRSWAVVTRKEQKVAMHSHAQSHISLVYYLQKPEASGGIRFTMKGCPNELAPNLFEACMGLEEEGEGTAFLQQWTPFNANHIDVDTEEGQMLIFPSKALHGTIQSESEEERISISADIVLMLKRDNNFEFLMPAFSNWRRII